MGDHPGQCQRPWASQPRHPLLYRAGGRLKRRAGLSPLREPGPFVTSVRAARGSSECSWGPGLVGRPGSAAAGARGPACGVAPRRPLPWLLRGPWGLDTPPDSDVPHRRMPVGDSVAAEVDCWRVPTRGPATPAVLFCRRFFMRYAGHLGRGGETAAPGFSRVARSLRSRRQDQTCAQRRSRRGRRYSWCAGGVARWEYPAGAKRRLGDSPAHRQVVRSEGPTP